MGWFTPSNCQFCGAPLGRTHYKILTNQGRKTICPQCHATIARQASKNALTDISEKRTPRGIVSEKVTASGHKKSGGAGCGCVVVLVIVAVAIAYGVWHVVSSLPRPSP